MKFVFFANTDWYLYNFRRSLLLALRDAGHEMLLVSPNGQYGEKLRELGFRWLPMPMDRRSLNPLREAILLLRLWRLFRRERPTLVHNFTIKCAVYGSLAARLAGRAARVNAVAGMGYVFTNGSFLALFLRPIVWMLLKIALGGRDARLILQNPDDAALFRRAGLIDPSKIRLILGSGVDCSLFTPNPSRKLGDKLRVLLPARLLWDKGLAEYVEAARLLRIEGRPIDFLLAGDPDQGNPAAVPESTVHGWVEEGVLQWLGHVNDMPSLFASVDVVVLPSYREGLPKGLIEAAASGCALITTDVPGCREVVVNDVDGLLVPVRDSSALACAIARLQDAPELRQRLANAACRKALDRFNERAVLRATFAVYSELEPIRHDRNL